MNVWTETGLKAALNDSDKLLIAAHELGVGLGADLVAMLPDDVLNTLRRMTHIIENMRHTVGITKLQAMHGSNK